MKRSSLLQRARSYTGEDVVELAVTEAACVAAVIEIVALAARAWPSRASSPFEPSSTAHRYGAGAAVRDIINAQRVSGARSHAATRRRVVKALAPLKAELVEDHSSPGSSLEFVEGHLAEIHLKLLTRLNKI